MARRLSSDQRRGVHRLSSSGSKRRRRGAELERLEDRRMLSVSTINATSNVRAVSTQLLGINTATWDGQLSTSTTLQLAKSAGLTAVRLPGGSSADVYHFSANPSYNESLGQMAEFAAQMNATAVVTINYGSGSVQEGVAMWAYLNGSTTDNTVIGSGPEFNTTTNTWVSYNWQTVSYWASLRAASPLKTDDGLNFLRLGTGSTVNHPGPFNLTDWEVGNEEYGSWEEDGHAVAGDGLTLPAGDVHAIHDPTTYIAFAAAFAKQVRSIITAEKATPIIIGVDSSGPDNSNNNWITNLLLQGKAQGFIPDFISDHVYDQGPGNENDAALLADPNTPEAVATGNSSYDWAQRAAEYQSIINNNLGSAGANIQLLATEVNSVYGDPGKQSVSLVNGLFIADSLGSLAETSYNGAWVWDLHNGGGSTNNDSSSLYGWREYGDYGIIGNGAGGPLNQPNPNYFAEQLLSKILQSGGEVVSATSDSSKLDTFAVKEPNGDLDLLVVNKNPATGTPPNNTPVAAVTEKFTLQNFLPSGAATIYQYGVTQDDAADLTGTSSLLQQSTTLSLTGTSFSYAVPDYSMTVIDLQPDTGPTVKTAAAGPGSPVTGTTAALSVLGAENGTDTGLTYTWAATGPAAVTYTGTINGTNAAKNITAVFTQSGTYAFTATITDGYGLTTTSTTSVTVTPAWLSAASVASYNFSSHILTATGATTIIADPGTAEPIITGATSAAKVLITPAISDTDIHVGGISLTGGASVDVSSVGVARSHANHNVLVVGTSNSVSSPTFLIAATSKLNLEDNDLIIHTGSSDTTGLTELGIAQAAAAQGRNVAPGGVYDGTWTGNGLTSSTAASVDAAAGYEQNVLAVELNSDMLLGGYAATGWVVGSANEPVGKNDILVKYTYNGDLNLDGAVDGNAATIFSTFYDGGASTQNDFAFGDFNGDGKVDGNDATIFSTLFGNGTAGSGLSQL